MRGCCNTDIGGQQHGLEFFVEAFVKFASDAEQTAQTCTQLGTRFAEAGLQAGQPACCRRFRSVFFFAETKHECRGLMGAAPIRAGPTG